MIDLSEHVLDTYRHTSHAYEVVIVATSLIQSGSPECHGWGEGEVNAFCHPDIGLETGLHSR